MTFPIAICLLAGMTFAVFAGMCKDEGNDGLMAACVINAGVAWTVALSVAVWS